MEIVDVKFKYEEYVFHYRVAGVIEKEGKYLVQQILYTSRRTCTYRRNFNRCNKKRNKRRGWN